MPELQSQPIRFYFRGQAHQIDACAPTRTVLQTLREDLHCSGTKEACAEGDCGACTVVVGQLEGDQVRMQAINSCIQFVPSLDGKALYTVEDLQQPDGSLHPVQQALVDCHASQCGFCTPGFVMSLWALYLQRQADGPLPTRDTLLQVLSGNLCRCTGYKPIIDAGLTMHNYPLPEQPLHPALPTLAQLQALQAQGQGDQAGEGWQFEFGGQTCFVPRTRAELGRLRLAWPDAVLLAGGTDVGLWVTKQLRILPTLIYLGQMQDGMREIRYQTGEVAASDASQSAPLLEIGALVSLNDAYAAICRHSPQQLHEFWQRFASHPIRNIGTLGGNLANGSPIGDSMPWLIVLGAQLVLHTSDAERVMPLEDFYLAYQKKDLRAGEWVAAVRIPLPPPPLPASSTAAAAANLPTPRFRTYKLSKRFDQDISAVCAAFAITLDQATGHIHSARVAFGGMAATPKRASLCEAALQGQVWNQTTLELAMAALAQDYQPLSDMRASSHYRLQGAQQLLKRFWFETRPDAPLPPEALNVFAHPKDAA
jgi:xanthine dehydrogenase small subunit